MHALVCNDDKAILATLQHALEKMGYEVHCSHLGEGASEALRHDNLRLVITDWDVAKLKGVDLCRAVRSLDIPDYVYIIMLLGSEYGLRRVEALYSGADDIIAKPINSAELLACLNTAERVLSLETRNTTLFAMAKLAESRDPETGTHLERMQNFSQLLAQQLALSDKYRAVIDPEFIRLIFKTSSLHDIGKAGVPDAVLLKPGPLNAAERKIMELHVRLGVDTLDAAMKRFPKVRFLRMARDIAATHHEKFDGTGYPAGLRGDEIPLSGRIVAMRGRL